MAETEAPAIAESKPAEAGKIVSAGKPELIRGGFQPTPPASNIQEESKDGATATSDAKEGAAILEGTAPAPTVELTDEQLAAYFKSKGIEYEGIDKLKEKIHPPKELSKEELAKQQQAKEKRLVDMFVAGGGTVEQYVAIKNVAEADLSELSRSSLKKELKDAGFSDEQSEQIIKDRYYQDISDEDLEQYEEETDKEFAKRKKEYGAKKLATRSEHTKKQAQGILAELNQAAESEDLQAEEERTLLSKIDETFKTLPRKLTFEIGKANNKDIAPIEYDVAETDLAEVQAMLKDPVQRQQFLYNSDGGLNLSNISNLLTRNKILESAIKASYLTGGARQVEIFEDTFPARTAHELGAGGSPKPSNPQKGKVVSWSKPEVIRQAQR